MKIPYDYAIATNDLKTPEETALEIFGKDAQAVCVDIEDHGGGHVTYYYIVREFNPNDFFNSGPSL